MKTAKQTMEDSRLLENRENLYRLLGRLYKEEIDQTLLSRMAGMHFPVECGDDELAAGYRQLEACLRRPGPDPVTDLAVDYAKVFLRAGIAKDGSAAFPYESVYTSPEHLIMQDARDQVVAAYRARGCDKAEDLHVPEDHIALELEFMAHLCGEARRAYTEQDRPAASACLEDQRDFLVNHLLNWAPAFCADVQRCADTDFYKAVAKITSGYLRLERAIVDDLVAEAGAQAHEVDPDAAATSSL